MIARLLKWDLRLVVLAMGIGVTAAAWLQRAGADAAATSQPDVGAAAPQRAFQTGVFHWRASGPLITPSDKADVASLAIKDPSVVFHQGKWHVFYSARGQRGFRTEYTSFADWKDADGSPRTIINSNDRSYCAPQVFYFTPHKKWYLIAQTGGRAWPAGERAGFATTADISKPGSWSRLSPMGAPGGPGRKNRGLDFWVICDDANAYLFFTSDDGCMWREQTPLAQFPTGWSKPQLALKADIFEASHTYRLKGMNKYLTIVEALGDNSGRYYKAYLADRLDGQWTPLADSRQRPFAAMGVNVDQPTPAWTDQVSHGELLRAGVDQTMEVDPANLKFLIQGVLRSDALKAKAYGLIPYRLGILELVP